MSLFALIVASLSLLIWTVLTFFRGAFWQLRPFDDESGPSANVKKWPGVIAIVPARDEAATIERCVASLAAQDYPGGLRIIVVDDHSADGTGALAQQAATTAGATSRFTLHTARPLETGWTGKLWALQQGVDLAASSQAAPEFFWFTDADITHAPDTLRRLVSRAEGSGLDLASLMVLLQAKSLPEKLLIPAFLYFFLKLYPPRWIADRDAKTGGAAGGCILLRRAALDRIGGLRAIRGEIIDDCALALRVKRTGGAIWMGLTRKSVSLRCYTSFGEIRDLVARTAFTQLGYSAWVLVGTVAGMLLTYVAPIVAAFDPRGAIWCLGLAAWALMTVTYLPTVRFYRLPALWAPALPLAAIFYSWATWLSAWRYWRGRGAQWKGRAQAPPR